MRIRNLALSVFPNELFPVFDVITQSWPSIQLGDEGIEVVLKALTLDAGTLDIMFAMVRLKRVLDQARKRPIANRLGHYEVGWKDGQRFLKFRTGTGREVVMIARSDESDFWIDIYLDFGRKGSRHQVQMILENLRVYEKRLKHIGITSVEGMSPFGDSIIDAALQML